MKHWGGTLGVRRGNGDRRGVVFEARRQEGREGREGRTHGGMECDALGADVFAVDVAEDVGPLAAATDTHPRVCLLSLVSCLLCGVALVWRKKKKDLIKSIASSQTAQQTIHKGDQAQDQENNERMRRRGEKRRKRKIPKSDPPREVRIKI